MSMPIVIVVLMIEKELAHFPRSHFTGTGYVIPAKSKEGRRQLPVLALKEIFQVHGLPSAEEH
jgi:hypothetical protein